MVYNDILERSIANVRAFVQFRELSSLQGFYIIPSSTACSLHLSLGPTFVANILQTGERMRGMVTESPASEWRLAVGAPGGSESNYSSVVKHTNKFCVDTGVSPWGWCWGWLPARIPNKNKNMCVPQTSSAA